MGLFDRLRNGDEEEVELRPPGRQQRRGPSRDEVELGDEGDDDFILPGFSPGTSSRSQGSTRRSRDRETGRRGGDDRLTEILEQNDRIIALLEDIAGESAGSSGNEQPMDDLW